MTIPWPGGPDSSVNGPDTSSQMAQGIQVMVRQLASMNQAIVGQTAMMQRTINASSRFSSPGQQLAHGAGQPQMNQGVVQSLIAGGGTLAGSQLQQVTPMSATTSLESLQSFAAQQVGQWIAGMPLYGPRGGSPGMTPVGTPTSGNLPSPPPGPGPGVPTGTGWPPARPPGGGNPPRPPQPPPLSLMQRVGVQVAASAGGPGTITNALRSIPGVGLITDIANWGAGQYLKQREAGRIYQGVEGGSNLDAQTERLHALAYETSMYGRMPQGAVAQAFGAVTAMGYNQAAVGEGQQPQNRQSALNFIYGNYTKTGMDTTQSLQVLETASQDATVGLNGVGDALNKLSTVAGQAGANADIARQKFNGYFNDALAQGMGNGGTVVAGGIASMQASMGKEFSGVNFSGELSQRRQYLLSGMSGITPAQLQYTARNNPGAYNKLLAGQNLQLLKSGGLMTSQMSSSMAQMIQAAGGPSAIMSDPSVRDQVASQFLNTWQLKGNINEGLWAQEISALTGVPMTPAQAFQWIVSQSAGVNEASHNAALSSSSGASVSAKNTAGAPTGKYGLAQGYANNWAEMAATLGIRGRGKTWQQLIQGAGPAGDAYLAQESKTGKRSPVLEALLQSGSSSNMVAVHTATGQRVMSMADAMKYYPNELASGNVEFYDSSGKAIGGTAALTNGLINTGAKTAAEQKQKAGSGLGTPLSKYLAQHQASQSAAAASGQAVTVGLSAEAQQLLKLLPSNSDAAAASSTVPANPYASQASR